MTVEYKNTTVRPGNRQAKWIEQNNGYYNTVRFYFWFFEKPSINARYTVCVWRIKWKI